MSQMTRATASSTTAWLTVLATILASQRASLHVVAGHVTDSDYEQDREKKMMPLSVEQASRLEEEKVAVKSTVGMMSSKQDKEATTPTADSPNEIHAGRISERSSKPRYSKSMAGAAVRFLQEDVDTNHRCDYSGEEFSQCICTSDIMDCDCSEVDSRGTGHIQCVTSNTCRTFGFDVEDGKAVTMTYSGCYRLANTEDEYFCFGFTCHSLPCDERLDQACPVTSSGQCSCEDKTCSDGLNSISFDCGDGLKGDIENCESGSWESLLEEPEETCVPLDVFAPPETTQPSKAWTTRAGTVATAVAVASFVLV